MNRESTATEYQRRRESARRRHRAFALVLAALVAVLMIAWQPGARAVPPQDAIALPGQPNGIPEAAHTYNWRPEVGALCMEDWTNGFLNEGIAAATAKWSESPDLALYYRTDCEAAGFSEARTTTYVNTSVANSFHPTACAYALVWTTNGYLEQGVVTRAVIHLVTDRPNCFWHQGTRDQELAAHEFGHVLGLKHPSSEGQSWETRLDTVMSSLHYVTAWDFYRADISLPW